MKDQGNNDTEQNAAENFEPAVPEYGFQFRVIQGIIQKIGIQFLQIMN
jgi:hypothetical protein